MQLSLISRFTYNAMTEPSNWLRWLLFGMIFLAASPLSAEENMQNISIKKKWRVVEYAPYRVITAHPPLKTNGETLRELGHDSISELLSSVEGQTQHIGVAFSPNGRFIASGAADNTVKLWDVNAKVLLHSFDGHSDWVNSVAFSPDSRIIASGSRDKTVKLWDVEAKALLHSFKEHSKRVFSVAFSPDGRFIASGSEDNTVKLWDVQAKTLLHSFEGHSGLVYSVAFSLPDGRFIASGSADNTVKLWDVQAKALLNSFLEHSNWVYSVAFSHDGRFIASGSLDNTIRLWDVQTKSLLKSFKGHSGLVYSVAFSPDSRFIASGSWDNTVKLWDVQAKTLLHSFEGHSGLVYSVAFSFDGRFIAYGSLDNTIKLWDVQAKSLLKSFEGHSDSVYSVAISPDERIIASGSRDNTIKLWDVQAKALSHYFEGHSDSVNSVAFSPDGRLMASGSRDNTVKLWDLQAKSLMKSFEGHSDSVNSVAFSPDGRLMASGSRDNTVKLWDLQTESLMKSFEGHSGLIYSVALSPDGRYIASGSWDNTVKLWDVRTKALLHTFEGHSDAVYTVAISPDARSIASGSWDNTVKLWDVQAKALIHTFEGHSDSVFSVAFSPDGRFIASGSRDNTVNIWDVYTKALLHSFEGHSRWVSSVSFSSDSRFIASGSYDNTVKLWDVDERRMLQTFLAGREGNWLSIDGDRRVLRGDDGTFLKKRISGKGDRPQFPMSVMNGQNELSISVFPESMTIIPGESKDVRIQITNKGTKPVCWLHLKPSMSSDQKIRLDPPNNLLNGMGKKIWKPTRIALIEPEGSANLHARITPHLDLPSDLPNGRVKPGKRKLTLTISFVGGTEVSPTIDVDYRSPYLTWEKARLERDGKILKIELRNSGNVALRDITIGLHTHGLNEAIQSAGQQPAQQKLDELEPADVSELAFVLPDNYNLNSKQLKLQGQTSDLPIFTWELASPEIKQAVNLVYVLSLPILLVILIALFYLRRYRHPLIVQLSNEPQKILQLPPEQIKEARNRLVQTGRLQKIMSEAGVTRHTFLEAVAFISKKTPEEKAQWLTKRLGAQAKNLQPGLWELSLPENFPLNLARCLLYFPAAKSDPKDLLENLKAIPAIRMHPTIMIGLDSEFQRKFREKTKDRTNNLVAPSGSDLTRLLLGGDPETVLSKVLAEQLILAQLSPYQLGGGVNRESVFFGRQEIISHIMNRDPANYLIVSGRQLGKSSLLKALERRYKDRPEVTCCYLALANEVLVPRLASELNLSRDAGLEEIAVVLSKKRSRFLFLIDEADKFVRYERQSDYQILDALRQLTEEGHCNFILAGFWELYEHAVMDYQSPLKNFAEVITIGELETEACRRLAMVPMQNMRLKYANPSLVDQMLGLTGKRANLMAIVCHQILKQLKPDQRVIEAEDVERSLYSESTFNALKGWDAMTDDKRACRLDRIVVYSTIEKQRFDLAELVDLLNRHGLQPDGQMLDYSLARLKLGFVLGRDENRNYFYQVPLFREMIMQSEPAAVRLDIELVKFC